ncbi:MAG: gliding motility-associated C-terminal domain-containing protein [Bacteroidota bacterium]
MFFKKLNYFSLLFTLILITHQSGFAQKSRDNFGNDFWFTMLENYTYPVNVSFVIANSSVPNTTTISCGIFNKSYTIYAKDTVITFTPAIIPNANYFVNQSINIKSVKNISLYAMNNSVNSSDIASIIPTSQMPFNPIYFVNTYRGGQESSSSNCSEMSIVAIDDSCLINILPSAETTNFDPKDTLIRKWLRKGEIYWLQARDSQSFAGSKIWNTYGCKRFSVFEGAKCSRVIYNPGCSGCDHLYNQTRPIQYQGQNFTTLPFTNITKGYLLQIVASENNTTVLIDGSFATAMNERDVFYIDISNNASRCITTDKKVSVIQIMKSGVCNGSNLGNPSIMTLLPDEQVSFNAQFSLPITSKLGPSVSNPSEFYLGLVCPKGTLGTIKVNNKAIDTTLFTIHCDRAVGSIPILYSNAYSVQSPKGFLAYIYANGIDESYATEIGSGFDNVTTRISVVPDVSYICDSATEFTFKAKSDSTAQYLWKFGDATTANGDSIVKAYNKTGHFDILLTVNFPNNNGCKSDTFKRSIDVYRRPVFSLGKDTTLCQGKFFTLAPFVPAKSKFLWNDNSKNKTFNVSNSAKIFLTITDTNSCTYSDSVDLKFINCDTNSIQVPNVFTPGDVDDFNDLLEAKFTGFDKLEGNIYNRWGILVYSFIYPQESFWNGGLKNDMNNPCPAGTYFYIYHFSNSATGLTRDINGSILLIR